MSKRILIIDGHPDATAERYLHALSAAYRDGAREAAHEVRGIVVSELQFPLLRTSEDFRSGIPTPTIRKCQEDLAWADHVVILFPLWLGSMPALLKGFFEQVLRPGFAFAAATRTGLAAEASAWQIRTDHRDHGHAGPFLSLVLSGSQPEEPGAQHIDSAG